MRLCFASALFSTLVLASSCGNAFWRNLGPQSGQNSGSAFASPNWIKPNVHEINPFNPVRQAKPVKQANPSKRVRAEVDLVPAGGSGVAGKVFLEQDLSQKSVVIRGEVRGLRPGLHGFHVHEVGATGNDCKDAGAHFNPFGNSHGAPFAFSRHSGDLGNVLTSETGLTRFRLQDSKITLQEGAKNGILGLSIVIHEAEDDLGFGGNEDSLKTGNAGSRLACGVIRRIS